MKKIILQTKPIDINQKIGTVQDGSIVTFLGQARNKSKDKEVLYLEYEIYESMAQKELSKIVDKATSKWSLSNCLVIHRYGRVNIAEASILIAVSSPHRAESFQAAKYIIDEIKKKVPIWKKEFYSDGSQWITPRP